MIALDLDSAELQRNDTGAKQATSPESEVSNTNTDYQTPNAKSVQTNYRFIDGEDSTVVRFKLKNRTLTISAKVNNKKKLKFLLGTGRKGSVLSKKAADKLDLEMFGESEVRGSAVTAATRLARIDSVQVENLIWYPGQFEVVEDEKLSTTLFGKIDGILGYEFFMTFPMRVNFQWKRLVVFDGTKANPARPGSAIEIDLENRQAVKRMTFDDQPINVLIDLAVDGGFVVFDDWAWSKKYASPTNLDFSRYTHEDIRGYRFLYSAFGRQWLVFDDIKVDPGLVIGRRSKEAQQFAVSDAAMGVGFLDDFNLFIDFANSIIYFEELPDKK
jgi:hypothetical protein